MVLDWITIGWIIVIVAVILIFIGIIALILSKNPATGWLIGIGVFVLIAGICSLVVGYMRNEAPDLCSALKDKYERGDAGYLYYTANDPSPPAKIRKLPISWTKQVSEIPRSMQHETAKSETM